MCGVEEQASSQEAGGEIWVPGVLDLFPLLRLTKGSPINQKSQPAPGFGIILNNIKPAPNSTKPGPIPEWI